eukprot:TRINITY_DN1719_c0_g2_i8.p1 TRINITY_DN1719_c0_g2~~TRINITY_DN1719_c0_g2_i8.p1  ORF type:complete len:592 (-),score=84.03 TRINITY_DN1719_c0_g2_i8:256-1884(-)
MQNAANMNNSDAVYQPQVDINVEISDGSAPTEADVNFAMIYAQTNAFGGSGSPPDPGEILFASGWNWTEHPFYFAFYGSVFVLDVSAINQETPILHRFYPYEFFVNYEVWACNRNRQSLVGLSLCENMGELGFSELEESAAQIYAGITYTNLAKFCPLCLLDESGERTIHPQLWVLEQWGYEYDPDTFDMSTPAGFGNSVGKAYFEYAKADGWNFDGTMVRSVNPMPFEDYTGYVPPNTPHQLVYPLGWQPLKETDGQGFFYFQEHVTPQAGRGKPISLTEDEIQSRQVQWPYKGSITDKELNSEDEQKIRQYSEELFQMQRGLTDTQKMLITFFDYKLPSFGLLPFNFESPNPDKSPDRSLMMEIGMNIALYTSTVLVWKEKLRHNAVRPPSIIHYMYNNETIVAWGGYGTQGGQKILGKEFSPYIRTMPHSEYPSASACVCETITEYFREIYGGNDTLPLPHVAFFPKGSSIYEPDVVPAKDTIVLFRTFSEISRVCGESRLWGGLHFRPAVDAGRELCQGVGKRIYEDLQQKSGYSLHQ